MYAGYDAVVYSAASSYYQQQQAAKAIGTWAAKKPGTQQFKAKPKGPPKTPQLHYCDVCKISCAGPQVSIFISATWKVTLDIFCVICSLGIVYSFLGCLALCVSDL